MVVELSMEHYLKYSIIYLIFEISTFVLTCATPSLPVSLLIGYQYLNLRVDPHIRNKQCFQCKNSVNLITTAKNAATIVINLIPSSLKIVENGR